MALGLEAVPKDKEEAPIVCQVRAMVISYSQAVSLKYISTKHISETHHSHMTQVLHIFSKTDFLWLFFYKTSKKPNRSKPARFHEILMKMHKKSNNFAKISKPENLKISTKNLDLADRQFFQKICKIDFFAIVK